MEILTIFTAKIGERVLFARWVGVGKMHHEENPHLIR